MGDVLERTLRRIERHLHRRGLLRTLEDDVSSSGEGDPESNLTASAVSGQAPPAGPQWVRGLAPLEPHALSYDKPLCVSLDGFTLHAATRAGGHDAAGREALLRYVLRPPVAQERLEQRPFGLVRISLKKAYADGTVAVDMDPLSRLCRLATSVPPPPAFAHREVRGRARGGEPVEVASRAASANGADPGQRRAREAAKGRRIPPLGRAPRAYLRRGRSRLS